MRGARKQLSRTVTKARRCGHGRAGFTLVELVVTVAIVMVLAAAALPLATVSIKRSREVELRRNLRTIRRAIDDFHKSYLYSQVAQASAGGRLPGRAASGTWSSPTSTRNRPQFGSRPGQAGAQVNIPGVKPEEVPLIPTFDISSLDPIDSKGYPPELKTLVEGMPASTDPDDKVKFLRRIPKDPMVPDGEWGMRSYQDRPDSLVWGRQNVYDVYSKCPGVALDGTHYKDW